jgi:AraC-type DNA-binding domain-containing proteins
MLHRFPPTPAIAAADASFLARPDEVYAKLKIESVPGKRTVLMTEHTLIFVRRGVKLLHFPGETARVSAGEVFLLRKGIYVMAEYIEEHADFEAIMLFLPGKLLRAMAAHGVPDNNRYQQPYIVFDSNPMLNGFRESLRTYFHQPPAHLEHLLPLKQKEVLLLLLSGPKRKELQSFIRSAVSSEPTDMDFMVREYLLQPVTIQELAGLCNCSLAKFKRDFQARYGCSPRTWINQQRLSHARMLLHNTNKTVNEISMDCGFENTSYFIRLFKEAYGHTPAAERAKIAMV